MTTEQYEMLLDAQEHGCAVCGKNPTAKRPLVVDHCHQSNRIRALLCNRCNLLLGAYEEFRERGEAFLAKYGQGNPLLDR